MNLTEGNKVLLCKVELPEEECVVVASEGSKKDTTNKKYKRAYRSWLMAQSLLYVTTNRLVYHY